MASQRPREAPGITNHCHTPTSPGAKSTSEIFIRWVAVFPEIEHGKGACSGCVLLSLRMDRSPSRPRVDSHWAAMWSRDGCYMSSLYNCRCRLIDHHCF